MNRNQQILKVSIQGILVNLILVGFKSFIGLLANSIAIILASTYSQETRIALDYYDNEILQSML